MNVNFKFSFFYLLLLFLSLYGKAEIKEVRIAKHLQINKYILQNKESYALSNAVNLYWVKENSKDYDSVIKQNSINSINLSDSITISGNNISRKRSTRQQSIVLDPNKSPDQNFDLSKWKLNTPENNGKGLSKTISVSELNNGYQHKNYFYTGSDGGLVFKCPVNGFKTSTKTKYTRVELREMLRGTNTSISTKGVNKNNWVFGTAPDADRNAAAGYDGKMKATLAINHVTTTGHKSHVGRLVIGQIHSKKDEPLRLYYRKLKNNTLGSIYFAHEPTKGNGNEQWYEMIGSKTNNATNPVDGIALDEKFTYIINVVGDTLTVTISRQGKDDVVKTVNMVNSGFNVVGQYMYFKAGLYHLNNSGDDDDYAQITFYELEKSHTTN